MTATPAGIAGLDRIAQVKLPVTPAERTLLGDWLDRIADSQRVPA